MPLLGGEPHSGAYLQVYMLGMGLSISLGFGPLPFYLGAGLAEFRENYFQVILCPGWQ